MRKKADMHKVSSLSKITAWQRIRRTPYQSVASIFMMFITLLVFAIFLLLAASSSAILSYFETKPQLTVFFKDEKDKNSIDALIEKLKSTNKVASYQYISKEQALAIYREQNKDDPLLLEMVTADILPSSLEISATSPKHLGDLAEIVKKELGIDEVVYQKDIVETLISWTTVARRIGAIFIIFLLIATFFILFTSIGMKIAFAKEEIEILKLVGATPWYIRKPFIFEGIIYGLIGAASSWLLVSLALFYLHPFIASFLQGISALPLIVIDGLDINIWPPTFFIFILLLLILFTCGIFVGLISSLFAVSRYLKY